MKELSPTGSIYQAGTLSGNPLAMSAGLATLTELNNNNNIYVYVSYVRHRSNSDSSNSINNFNLSLRDARKNFEENYLKEQLKRFKGNIAKTSTYIGMDRSALHRKLKELNININIYN